MKIAFKKAFLVLFTSMLLVSLLPISALSNAVDWSGSAAVGFNSGVGTETDPYIIATAEQLSYLAQTCNEGNSYYGCFFELANDITLNSADLFSYNESENVFSVKEGKMPNTWIPIGNSATVYFSGTFDGCNHRIIGLYIDSESDYQGLFGYCKNSYIQNIGVAIGYVKGGQYVGGIIGYNLSENGLTTVSNCYNNCTVSGKSNVGGVVGYNIVNDLGKTIVTGCYNTAVITSRTGYVGGIVGVNSVRNLSQMTVSNCFNIASITSSSKVAGGRVGGIVGQNYSSSSSTSTVSTSYNIGAVNSACSSVGGIVGYNWSDDSASATVFNCYNTGLVDGSMYNVGGVVGTNYSTNGKEAIVSNCYNIGSINGSSNLGGVVGNNTTYSGLATAKVKNCYYYDQCTKKISSYGNPLTDTEMRMASSFNGFNFNTVWTIDGSFSYPYPELINNGHERAINVCSHKRTILSGVKAATCCESGYTGDTYYADCGEKIAVGTVILATGDHIDTDGKWETNCTHHWHTCYFGTQFDIASHIGGTATCTEKAQCSVCGVEYGEYCAHGKTEIRNAKDATCCEDGYTGDTYCKDCNTKIENGSIIPAIGNHADADGKWETDGTKHWHTCYHGTTFDEAVHSGGTATCKQKAVCKDCGIEYGDYAAHSFINYVYNKDAKCGIDGTETAKCDRCTETDTRTAAGTALKHNYVAKQTSAPSCTASGLMTYTCSLCKDSYTEDIDAHGHSYKTSTTKATLTADGKTETKCTVCGKVSKTTTIYYPKTFTLSATKFTYTGKEIKPTVTVKNGSGKVIAASNYTVSYSNNTNTGTGKVTIKFKGNYSGTKTVNFTITPKQVTGLKVSDEKTTSLKLTWSKTAGAKYYKVEQSTDGKKWKTVTTTDKTSYTVKSLKAGTKYQFRVTALDSTKKIAGKVSSVLKTGTLTKAPTLTLKSTKSKTAAASWKKVTGASKYVVYKSTNGKKWTKVTTTTKTSYNLTKLTGGKKIYVKVAALNAYSKASAYSGAKNVTVKK